MNPKDVFPKRNLPNEAEQWGREIETRIVDLENASISGSEGLTNENRTTAAVTAELARQLEDLTELLERVEELYESIPKTFQSTNRETGFSSDNEWKTINLIAITPPEGTGTVAISAFGSAGMVYDAGGSATISARIVIDGSASGTFRPNENTISGGQIAILSAQHSRTYAKSTPFNVALQVVVNDPSSFPAHSSNYASLSVIASFTG